MRPWLKIALLVPLAGVAALWLAPAEETVGVSPGNAAPPIVLPDLKGREVTLASLRGKAVVVNFWATWCAPCKEEMPELVEAWKGLRGRWVERFQVPYPVLQDGDGDVARAYGVTGLPRTYVVGPGGDVRKVLAGRVSRSRLESALLPAIPSTCPGS
jgi:cytochrome c biogenesis protein CcmG/thiol:disulfide interchange protein DsbE